MSTVATDFPFQDVIWLETHLFKSTRIFLDLLVFWFRKLHGFEGLPHLYCSRSSATLGVQFCRKSDIYIYIYLYIYIDIYIYRYLNGYTEFS